MFLRVGIGLAMSVVIASNASAEFKYNSDGTSAFSFQKACIQSVNSESKTVSELKAELEGITQQQALKEVYGAVFVKKNGVGKAISKPLLKAGILRPVNDPEYYNGDSFGEVCISTSYEVTEDDMRAMEPSLIQTEQRCFNKKDIHPSKLKPLAVKNVVSTEIRAINPRLNEVSEEQLFELAYDVRVDNDRIDMGTGAYCGEFSFYVVKYEISSLSKDDFNELDSSQSDLKSKAQKITNGHLKVPAEIYISKDLLNNYPEKHSADFVFVSKNSTIKAIIGDDEIETKIDILNIKEISGPISSGIMGNFALPFADFQIVMKDGKKLNAKIAGLVKKFNALEEYQKEEQRRQTQAVIKGQQRYQNLTPTGKLYSNGVVVWAKDPISGEYTIQSSSKVSKIVFNW